MDKEENNNIFDHKLVKKICIVLYFISLATFVVGWLWKFADYIKLYKGNSDPFIIFIFIMSLVFSPFLLMLAIYPLYAIAYIADKNRQIVEEQEVIEHLLAKIAVLEQEAKAKNNEEENKEVTE